MKLQVDDNGRYHITIPRAIARAKGWQKGDEFSFNMKTNGKLEMENMEQVEE